jgi:hypothetical protein
METEIISVIDVSKNLGKQKAHIFKILKRLSIETVKEKSSNAKGQKIAYITSKNYDLIKNYLINIKDYSEEIIEQSDLGGVFYLIQLEPEHDPGRFKLGFATNIEERLRSHKTAAPFAKVLKTWPSLLWEKTAIDCVTQGCVRIHTEVFRAESIDEVTLRCESFFNLMPGIKSK